VTVQPIGDRLLVKQRTKATGREPGLPGRILMIEDDLATAEMYAFRLREAGWQVDIAVNGEDGIARATKRPPDLLLLDMVLPGIDGVEVLRRLRVDERTRNLPTFVLSNSPGQGGWLENAKALGILGWLTKATTMPDDLVAYLRRISQ
jgi:CheY-like chemotaxis protein